MSSPKEEPLSPPEERVYPASEGTSPTGERIHHHHKHHAKDPESPRSEPQSPKSSDSASEDDDHVLTKHSKLSKFFGEETDITHIGPNFAPQPSHVKHITMKKKFGEDVDLGHDSDAEPPVSLSTSSSAVASPDVAAKERVQSRRVQKFFGESFDVKLTKMTEATNHKLKRQGSTEFQPQHVEVTKLNKFFGRHAPVKHRGDDVESTATTDPAHHPEEGAPAQQEGEEAHQHHPHHHQEGEAHTESDTDESDGSSSDEEEILDAERASERKQMKKQKKLRHYFGAPVDPEKDKDAKQYAMQPDHVKAFKLKKHFGDTVVVEKKADESSVDVTITVPEEVSKQRKLDTFFGARISDAVIASASFGVPAKDGKDAAKEGKPAKSPRSKGKDSVEPAAEGETTHVKSPRGKSPAKERPVVAADEKDKPSNNKSPGKERPAEIEKDTTKAKSPRDKEKSRTKSPAREHPAEVQHE